MHPGGWIELCTHFCGKYIHSQEVPVGLGLESTIK